MPHTRVASTQDSLGAIRNLEFGEDGGDVVGDCLAAEGEGLGDLVVVAAGGDQVQDLALSGGQFQGGMRETVDSGPSVSPDGRRIAFVRYFAGGILAQVHVMRADGSGAHPVTPPALEASGPDWTPDGRQILVSSKCCRPNSAIYQVRPDGTGLKRLTSPRYPNNDVVPSASPQGNRIVFASDRPYPDLCCKDLFIMRSDGSGPQRVPTGLDGVVDPDWGPAPRDDGTGAATMTSGSRERAGSAASSARAVRLGSNTSPVRAMRHAGRLREVRMRSHAHNGP